MSRGWSQLFRRGAPPAERMLELFGAAVIVLGVPALVFMLFEIVPVLGVLGLVLILGALVAGLIALLRRPASGGGRRAADDERGAAQRTGVDE